MWSTHAARDRLQAQSPGQRSLPQSWGIKHRPEDGSWPAADLGGAVEAMGGVAGRTRLHPMTRAELAEKFAEAEKLLPAHALPGRALDNSGVAN